ncbi:glycosyltransferase family 2 protein [Candidatus Bathyarchaeota archaeon]|nr:glycosyltransferase family 2 protein [Candidatus Bathyarchaeota archaeon]
MKYVALTSGRNEERFIRQTVEGVLSQRPAPSTYVVVDDGSTDATPEILDEYRGVTALRLENPRHPTRGVNLAWALNAGVRKATELVPDWDYLLKVDADSVIPKNYFDRLHRMFRENPRLGVSSGTPYDEKVWRGRASDGAKMYSRGCWGDVRHFVPCNAFDTLALLQAKRYGWVVQSFPEIKYSQLRTWRRGNLNRWILSGRSRYFLGFPAWHTFLIAIVYMNDRPWVLGSASMFLAHLLTALGGLRKPFPPEYYEFARKYAMWETLERFHERRLT